MTASLSVRPECAAFATRAPTPRAAVAAVLGFLLAACSLAHVREQTARRGPEPQIAAGHGDGVRRDGPGLPATRGCEAAVAAAADSLRLPVAMAAAVRQSLAAYHGILLRWPADPPAPIRVWVQPPTATQVLGATAAWTAGDVAWAVVRGARTWDGVVRGLAFVPTRDSATAAVRVHWEPNGGGSEHDFEHTPRGLHGHTAVIASRAGAITAADVTRGVGAGRAAVSAADLRAVAAHEFGHVLGLAHRVGDYAGERGAAASVMAADVRADGATADDRAVLRAWYALASDASCAPPAAPPD